VDAADKALFTDTGPAFEKYSPGAFEKNFRHPPIPVAIAAPAALLAMPADRSASTRNHVFFIAV
jgi:hypothetical protein